MVKSLVVVLLMGLASQSYAHRNDPDCQSNCPYTGHDASMCAYADGSTRGSISCNLVDMGANPCSSGRSTGVHSVNIGEHSHADFPVGKSATQACTDYIESLNPPVDPPVDPPECEHGDACDGYGEHDSSEHLCTVCDDQDNTCGWHKNHRHPGQCPNKQPDPPTVKSCTCCEGTSLSADINADCPTECASLLRQVPDACPVDPETDEPGCHDNPPHPYHNGCPGPNVRPGHDCASLDFHRHEDAFAGECHSNGFEHGAVGGNPHWADHESWGEHDATDHGCGNCDARDGTCGWHDGHRHPRMCPNEEAPPVVDPEDPVDDPEERAPGSGNDGDGAGSDIDYHHIPDIVEGDTEDAWLIILFR